MSATERRKATLAKYYKANRTAILARNKVYNDTNKERLAEWHKAYYKANRLVITAAKAVPCKLCKQTFPAVCMDFHHRNPEEKSFTIGARAFYSKDKLLAEIAKCDVYCANCHRIIEHVKEDE